ncbi:MAG: AAA family ATPase [Clostridiales bacterium]|nr:AAA family ATPase [Clostridiales bacterium]
MEYGLIGESLKHSYSKEIHNKLSDYDYRIINLSKDEFDGFIGEHDFKGINVTIPYKIRVMPFCATLSERAKRVGSVNTVTVDSTGKLHGYNTDYGGFVYMAERAGISFENKNVVILGSGGTSLTAQAVTEDHGAKNTVVVSRTGKYNYGNISKLYDYDIIINTTPVGMYPKNGENLIDLTKFVNCCGVIDVIYNPLYTALLQSAQRMNIPCTNGLSMLVAQAKFAREIFTGIETDDSEIERVYKEMTNEFSNIVLVGMPGSGKTTVGKMLAKKMNRRFADMDAYIEEKCGMTIPDIFAKHGEDYFRDAESEAAAQLGKEHGLVIATGGGAVIREINKNSLRQNGKTVWLKRDIERLSMNGRPLSKDIEAVRKLFCEREKYYSQFSDICVDNNGKSPDIAVKKILEEIQI